MFDGERDDKFNGFWFHLYIEVWSLMPIRKRNAMPTCPVPTIDSVMCPTTGSITYRLGILWG